MSTPVPDVAGASDFGEAARRVLRYLHEVLPLAFWSVTRVENGRQTYLYLDEDNGYGLPQGGSHAWGASFCIHMASGAAPAVALDAQAVPAYAAAAVNDDVRIGTYAGAVVREADGSVFGAICGLDPEARTDDRALADAGPVLSLLGQALSLQLALERVREAAREDTAALARLAGTDPLTGLVNRRGWEQVLREEELTLQRLGDPTVVMVVDVDLLKVVNDTSGHAAGDDLLRRAADALARSVRQQDRVARLGGDEFGVLVRGCTEEGAPQAVARVRADLEAADVPASIGWAPVRVGTGVADAVLRADAAMYDDKRARRAALGPSRG